MHNGGVGGLGRREYDAVVSHAQRDRGADRPQPRGRLVVLCLAAAWLTSLVVVLLAVAVVHGQGGTVA